jgi:uncharacterized protein YutE (UPF0331/DUF86 family)
MRPNSNLESINLERLAKQYRDEGYEVQVRPGPADLPDFLQGFEIDLLAKRPDVTVVVEVKWSADATTNQSLKGLSEILKERPGYRFDFVSLKRTRRKSEAAGSIDDRELCVRLRETESLLANRALNAAAILSWSAAEGALRLLAKREKVGVEGQNPALITKTLFSRGLLNKEQYDLLNDAVSYRNAAVHGFSVDAIHDPTIRALILLAKEILKCP